MVNHLISDDVYRYEPLQVIVQYKVHLSAQSMAYHTFREPGAQPSKGLLALMLRNCGGCVLY